VTYALSGLLLIAVGVAFERDLLSAATQTIGWMIVFFVASPAGSAAYLTVSETFPLSCSPFQVAGTRMRCSRASGSELAAAEQGRRHHHQNDG
jgi:hypothetical protein